MRTILTITLSLLAAVCLAQTSGETNFAAAGVSYQPGGSVAGTGLYARQVSATAGTYAFTVVDALPTTLKPLTVTTQFSAGVAQKIFTMGKTTVYIPTSAGISYSGTNTGWAWTTGALASIPIKDTAWRVMPHVRMVKSSVSAGEGYQLIVGALLGWGW